MTLGPIVLLIEAITAEEVPTWWTELTSCVAGYVLITHTTGARGRAMGRLSASMEDYATQY